MMTFLCWTEWRLDGLKRTKCSAVRSWASPTTGGSFFPDTDTSSSAISWPSPGKHTNIIQVNMRPKSKQVHYNTIFMVSALKKNVWSFKSFTLNCNVFHLAVVTHDSESLTALLSCSGKENHLKHTMWKKKTLESKLRGLKVLLTECTKYSEIWTVRLPTAVLSGQTTHVQEASWSSMNLHGSLTSTTTASPGCSTKRDGLIAKGGCSEKYVLAKDYIKKEKMEERESYIFTMTKDKKVKSHRFYFTLRFEAGHWFLGMMQKFPALRPTFWQRNSTNFTPPTRQKPQSRTLGTAQYGHVNSNWPNTPMSISMT